MISFILFIVSLGFLLVIWDIMKIVELLESINEKLDK